MYIHHNYVPNNFNVAVKYFLLCHRTLHGAPTTGWASPDIGFTLTDGTTAGQSSSSNHTNAKSVKLLQHTVKITKGFSNAHNLL